jgi:hypothetical protein
MNQLALPMQYDTRPRILGQPIVKTYLLPRVLEAVCVLGGAFAGKEFVYLLHFDRKVHRSRHYIGSTQDLERRIRQHRRKYPLYRLEEDSFECLSDRLIWDDVMELQRHLGGVNFRRKHTFLQAVSQHISDEETFEHNYYALLHAAKRHRSNGLVMAANQRGIAWRVAAVWQASRQWEFKLKQQKNMKRFCPVCQGVDVPF